LYRINLDNEHYSTQLLNLEEQRISKLRFARSHEHHKRGLWKKVGKVCSWLCQVLHGNQPVPLNDDSDDFVIDLRGQRPDPPPISEVLLTPDIINQFIRSLARVQTQNDVELFMVELHNVRQNRFEMYWAVVEWMMRFQVVYEDLTPMVHILWRRVAQDVLQIIREAHIVAFQEPFPGGYQPETLYQLLITPQVEQRLTVWICSRVTHEDYIDDFIEKMKTIRRQSGDWYWAISEWILRIREQYAMQLVEPWARVPLSSLADAMFRDMMANLPTLIEVEIPQEQVPVSPTEIMGAPINIDPSATSFDLEMVDLPDSAPRIALNSVQIPADEILNHFNIDNIEMTFGPVAGGGGANGGSGSNRGINALTFEELPVSPVSSEHSIDEVSNLRVKRDFTCINDGNGKPCHPYQIEPSHRHKPIQVKANVNASPQQNNQHTRCDSITSLCNKKEEDIEEGDLNAISSTASPDMNQQQAAPSLIDPDESVAALYSSFSELEGVDVRSTNQHLKKTSTSLVDSGDSVKGQISKRAGRFIKLKR